LVGEGFGPLADAVFSAYNLALFARGTRSSSELLQEGERLAHEKINVKLQ
jgi:hypothetical protein